MDRETARELIALIDAKIERLQKSKREIAALIGKDQLEIPMVEPATLGGYDNVGDSTQKIYEAMLTLGKPAAPKELFDYLHKTGIEISDARVRQILMRWKGRLFQSPKRGLWRAIKKED
ncbi:MAG: hypothetical protein CVT49_09800 [candidate division Zixibacteria bacterium HGW-Zixibacteria-1]|nr:MAG: hypothetical protein CVT49_09800 [candidate division Zixibacteria bacterium HGW-Zixibacteria-1]